MKTRYSASLIKVYKNCPFRFFCKINDKEKDTDVDMSYGDAGTTVHDTLEYYYLHLYEIELEFALIELRRFFDLKWESFNIQNPKINVNDYWLSVINGIKLNIKPTHLEYEFNFEFDDYTFLGYADVMNTKEHWIGDWKTATYKKAKLEGFKDQLKKYAWAYHKEFGVIPTTWVYFNKSNQLFTFIFTMEDIKGIELEIQNILKEVKQRNKDMNFERKPSRTNCYFCPYKGVCSTDLLRESDAPEYEVKFHFKKNKVLIESVIPEIIHRKIEKEINYEIKNAFFIIQAMAARGIKYDGIKRLYKRKDFGAETFIGYSNLIYKHLKEYAQGDGKKIKLIINECRDSTVLENKIKCPEKLNVDFELYDFQKDAASALIAHRWGICEVGTGGGKTAIAAECIRRLGLKTLFIIDNKDLLLQTKKEYEEMLGVSCGIIGMGYRDWSKDITLCTIQTLAKHVKEFAGELAKIPLVIYDETHIIASKSFETVSKYLVNSRYRFGFSATAKRDDGNDNLIYAHTGTIIYKRNARALINDGMLIDPESIFYNYGAKVVVSDNWQNEYNDGIVDNEDRNNVIKEITNKYIKEGKSVMILTKMIRHGDWFKENIEGSELIYGRTDDDLRVEILEDFKAGILMLLIGNIKIFNKGINIKNLDVLINASGNAGDVVTVQSIGRALRKDKGKTKAYYIDFLDAGTYLKKHSISRMDALKAEDYNVVLLDYKRGNI